MCGEECGACRSSSLGLISLGACGGSILVSPQCVAMVTPGALFGLFWADGLPR